MKVENMTNNRGNKVPNQFVVTQIQNGQRVEYFQSYNSMIACRKHPLSEGEEMRIYLDEKYWDYSVTTGKHRNIFLGEKKAETEKKIKSGEYILTNLN